MVGLIPLLPRRVDPARRWSRRGQSLGKRFASFMEAHARSRASGSGRAGTSPVDPGTRTSSSASSRRSGSGSCSARCCPRTRSCRRTACARCRSATATQPFQLELGGLTAQVDYEPGESTSGLFGGNSNWRGPVWMPTNYLVIVSLWNWDSFMGDDFRSSTRPAPGTRSGCATWPRTSPAGWSPSGCDDEDGRRPVFGAYEKFQTDPDWHDLLLFHEYFHGDTGAGIGASHQTGWTGLVAHLLCRGGLIDAIESGRSTARMGWSRRASRAPRGTGRAKG